MGEGGGEGSEILIPCKALFHFKSETRFFKECPTRDDIISYFTTLITHFSAANIKNVYMCVPGDLLSMHIKQVLFLFIA